MRSLHVLLTTLIFFTSFISISHDEDRTIGIDNSTIVQKVLDGKILEDVVNDPDQWDPVRIVNNEKKFERETGIKILNLNNTITSYFGGIFNQHNHYYLVNTTRMNSKLKAQQVELHPETFLFLTLTQQNNEDFMIELYMSEDVQPTEKRHSFSCDTRERTTMSVRLPPLKYNVTWNIMLKASPTLGSFSKLEYSLSLNTHLERKGNLMLIVLCVILVCILMGIAAIIYVKKKRKLEDPIVYQNAKFLLTHS